MTEPDDEWFKAKVHDLGEAVAALPEPRQSTLWDAIEEGPEGGDGSRLPADLDDAYIA